MEAYSDNKPNKVHVDIIGNVAHVSLSTNITQVETEDGVQYEYDYHLIKVPYNFSFIKRNVYTGQMKQSSLKALRQIPLASQSFRI